jgi:dihydrofolate reductase
MSLSLIAAIAQNNCIGKNGALPWHLPEDLNHFKELTVGKPVLMGRKTWESIPEKFRPLPNRTNIVVTRDQQYSVPAGVEKYSSVESALASHPNEETMVIGGAELYRQTIDRADRLFITHVNQTVDGDAFFPKIDPKVWREMERDGHEGFSFVTYRKINN